MFLKEFSARNAVPARNRVPGLELTFRKALRTYPKFAKVGLETGSSEFSDRY